MKLFFKLQRADQEAARNRDANAAAIAALGGGKISKKPWSETSNPFDQPITAGVSLQVCIFNRKQLIFSYSLPIYRLNFLTIHFSFMLIIFHGRIFLIKFSLSHVYEVHPSSFLFLYFLCRLIAPGQNESLCEICSW